MSAERAHPAGPALPPFPLLPGTPRPGARHRADRPVSNAVRARVFDAVLGVMSDAVLVTEAEPLDGEGPRIVYVNAAFTAHTGYTAQEVLGRTPRLLQGPGTDRVALDRLGQALRRWRPVQVELLNYRKDGTPFWIELSISPLADETAWFTHWVSVQRDVTERKQREERMREELELAREILSGLPAQTALLDVDGTVLAVNANWERFWADNGGVGPGCGVGANYLDVCEAADGSCLSEALRTAAGIRDVIEGRQERFVLDYECSSPDERRWYSLQVVPLAPPASSAPRRVLVSHVDITARKRGELTLAHQASHDALTGLANRSLVLTRLHGMLQQDPHGVALLFLDLDGFKSVNDSLGHAAGDDLLRAIAARLRTAAREQDLVGRLGGDEFLVCCAGVDTRAAVALGQRLAQCLSEPVRVGTLELHLSVSVGVAQGAVGASAEELMRQADAAMYRAKEMGRGRVEVFVEELREQADRRLRTTSALRAAVIEGRVLLHYQPIVELSTGVVRQWEALLRWDHEGELRTPGSFLDLAADAGLLPDIGTWVLDEACRDAARWCAAGSPVPVSVNVAPEQLAGPGLADAVHRSLARSGLPADLLVLELTEHGALAEQRVALDELSELRRRGVRIALDDFGTGYSALSHLAELPADEIKIDREFVSGDQPAHRAILAAVATLGRTLDLIVVAEGVETAQQAAVARAVGCTHGQGWLFGRPVPPADVRPVQARVPAPRAPRRLRAVVGRGRTRAGPARA
jgi:diguanylate cyclase (GGDEF)-like protein/PAS domain S-box-containing protein